MKRILAILLSLAMVLGLAACGGSAPSAPAEASAPEVAETPAAAPAPVATPEPTPEVSVVEEPAEPEGPVITGVTVRADDENFVDSARYSQYESVDFSDGTTQKIDVDQQTFILVLDGAIVNLADPTNWVPDAELYVIEKGQFDTVGMAMNTANWGPFYFTGAVDLDGGKYMESRSVPAAVHDAEVTDAGVTGGEINVSADYISGIYAYSENGDHYDIKDVTVRSSGLGGNDFGSKGGWGTVISTAGTADVDISGVKVFTEGPLHDGIWAGGSSVVDVNDSVIFAVENGDKFGFVPYSYDRFYITTAPLTDEEIAEKGLSGEYYEEPYEDMFGSGTKYYYFNDSYTSNFSAPMLQCVPLALGLYGSMRAACCFGSATLSFNNSLAVSDVWAVLSTDSGNGTLNATDTVAAVGVQTDKANAELTTTVGGEEYYIDLYDTTESAGYITYCDGFDDNFAGCSFYAPDYLAIITGGTFDFTKSAANRGFGASDRTGFMSHGNGYTASISNSDFDIADYLFSVKSYGAADITLDDVTVNWTRDNKWGHVLFQFMDTDDTGTGANDMEMDILDLTKEEYLANTAASDGYAKTVVIKNSTLSGDIYNSTGSSNNASTQASYDGTTSYLSTWYTSPVTVTLDNTTLDGVISTSYAQHVDAAGKPIGGQFFFNKTGEPMDGTAENTYDYLTSGRVINTAAYNGIGQISVVLTNGAVWNVTGTSIVNSITIGEGCTVNGTITENADGTYTVSPK